MNTKEILYDVIITDTETFVQEHSKTKDGEHITATSTDKRRACNIARKVARQFDLHYRKVNEM